MQQLLQRYQHRHQGRMGQVSALPSQHNEDEITSTDVSSRSGSEKDTDTANSLARSGDIIPSRRCTGLCCAPLPIVAYQNSHEFGKLSPSQGSQDRAGGSANLLLKLPGEIRNRIYLEYVEQDEPIDALLLRRGPPRHLREITQVLPKQPPLARTCKTIRHEVLSIWYGANRFVFHRDMGEDHRIEKWARRLPTSIRYLRHIEFQLHYTLPGPEDFWALSKLGKALPPTRARDIQYASIAISAKLSVNSLLSYSLEREIAGMCVCLLDRCVRDINRGVVSKTDQSPLIAFVTSWDILNKVLSRLTKPGFLATCDLCGKHRRMLSLRKPEF